MHGDHEDAHARLDPLDLGDEVDASASRHAEVEYGNVDLLLAKHVDCTPCVGSFGDHFDIFMILQQPSEALAEHLMVIGYEYADQGSSLVAQATAPK
jgi:hypothetical protein